MIELQVSVHCDGDWHIGQGAGQPGHIDRLIRRDPRNGLPFIPAKTLTGIWRDACEQIAAGLDAGGDGPWQNWVMALFGGIDGQPDAQRPAKSSVLASPLPALLSVRSAHLASRLADTIGTLPALREAMTFVKPGVKLDERTGVALARHLRMEEAVCGGARLTTTAELQLPEGPERETALALLWAGARIVERIGGKRRRGLGRCRLTLAGPPGSGSLDEDAMLKRLDCSDPGSPPKVAGTDERAFALSSGAGSQPRWHVVRLGLELRSPLVAFDGEIGNVVQSRDYCPGTYLLAALNAKLKRLLGADLFPAVARGAVRVLNAYPECNARRALPVPLAWHYEKDRGGFARGSGADGGPVYNHLLHRDTEEGAQRKQYRQGYVAELPGDSHPMYCECERQATTHGTIDDEHQRPSVRVGGVFTFEAIGAGTRLVSELWIDAHLCPQLSDEQIASLGGDYRLGKAKKDDYGQVRIVARRGEPCPLPKAHEDSLTVWLASTLLLRDARLRPCADAGSLKRELEKALDVKLELSEPSFVRVDRGTGWHQAWGLPRPTLVGLAPGSSVRFKVLEGELTEERLSALERAGLGERRAEGYGELLLNPPLLSRAEFPETRADPPSTGPLAPAADGAQEKNPADPLGRDDREYLLALVRRAWRRAIRDRALTLAASRNWRQQTLGWTDQRPGNSQLGALRSLIAGLYTQADCDLLRAWLDHLEATPNRRQAWPDLARAAVRSLIENPASVLDLLAEGNDASFPNIAGLDMDALRQSLRWEAARALWLAAIRIELRDREQTEEAR